jgi:hypothetical protein
VSEAVSYLTLDRGTPVCDRIGTPVGRVEAVLCHSDGLFDGIVVATPHGLRFVDAPEVREIDREVVTLGVTESEVANADPRRPSAPLMPRRGLRRLLGGAAERMPVARWGRSEASESDRESVVDSLKRAFVAGRLDTDELADCVARAHEATTLRELEDVLRRAGC